MSAALQAGSMLARCAAARAEAGGVMVYTLRVQGASAQFLGGLRPGRHVAVEHADASGTMQQRLYSITRYEPCSEHDGAGQFDIAVKSSGRGSVSDHMHAVLRAGSTLPLGGVAGDITADLVLGLDSLVMLAGGIGLTLPLALLRELDRLRQQGRRVPRTTLLLCFARMADIPFLQELQQLCETAPWFDLRIHITREDIAAHGPFVPGRPSQQSLLALGQPQAVVICGGHAFAQTFREHARACFPGAIQHIEAFTPPAASTAQPGETAQACQLQIAHSGQIVEAASGKSLLEILEGVGIAIRSQCRAGICGSCRIRITGGSSRLEADFCLSDREKEAGYALACCTFPSAGHIHVDLKPGT